MVAHHHELSLLQLDLEKWLREDPFMRQSGSRVDVPILGAGALATGVSHGNVRVPYHQSHILGLPLQTQKVILTNPNLSVPIPHTQVVKLLLK